MALTKQDIIDVIKSLENQGITATNSAIHDIVGGSNSTIQKHRKAYLDAKLAQAVKESIVLKDAEVSVLTRAFSDLLCARVTSVNSEYETTVDQLNQSLTEASNTNDVLSSAMVEQQKKLTEAQHLIEKLQHEIAFTIAAHSKEKCELNHKINELNELAFTQKGRADLFEERLKHKPEIILA